uniref:Zinc finger protein 79 n=1 Tax=Homo sapiens TaxID=9606 RepID=A0ABJ7HDM7_HUMAN
MLEEGVLPSPGPALPQEENTGEEGMAAGLELLISTDPPASASQCWDYRCEPPSIRGTFSYYLALAALTISTPNTHVNPRFPLRENTATYIKHLTNHYQNQTREKTTYCFSVSFCLLVVP